MSKFLPPSEILNNPQYIQIRLKPNGHGGVVTDHITHHTRVPSTDPTLPPTTGGWEDVLYFRYIGKHSSEESSKNGLGGYVYILTNEHSTQICVRLE
jgi:hypothetical protein